MSLTAAVTALTTIAGGLSGVNRVYTDPPESINEFPAAIVYAAHGQLNSASAGLGRNLHVIRIDIHASRTQLPQSVAAARGCGRRGEGLRVLWAGTQHVGL